jgi:hypothetical protein
MSRRLTLLLILAAALPAPAAPAPKDREKPGPLAMTREGDTKVSEVRSADSILDVTESVAKACRRPTEPG